MKEYLQNTRVRTVNIQFQYRVHIDIKIIFKNINYDLTLKYNFNQYLFPKNLG